MAGIERKQVRLGQLIRRHYLWAPLVPLIFALIFGLIARQMSAQADRLAVHGITGVATVTDRDRRIRRDSDGNERREHFLGYRFDMPTGGQVSFRRTVSEGLYSRVSPGAEIPVLFIPHDPDVHELEPGSNRQGAWIFGGLALVLAGVGAVAGGVLWRRKASLLRAARDGEVREARVTATVPTNVSVNGQPRFRSRWIDAAGTEGNTAMHPLNALPEPGAVIVVYIDPRTGTGWWEGDF